MGKGRKVKQVVLRFKHVFTSCCSLLAVNSDNGIRRSTNAADDKSVLDKSSTTSQSNIPESPAYGVYISQLIRYARACSLYGEFVSRTKSLTTKLVEQGYMKEKLKVYGRKFYGRYTDLMLPYRVSLTRMFIVWRYILMTPESLEDPDLFYYTHILQARFSQLHAPSKYAGNQCTSAALYSLVKRTTKHFYSWDADTMDEVLLQGTELHGFLRDGIQLTSHPDMRVSLYDLPEYVPVFIGNTCIVAKGTDTMVYGLVVRESDEAVSLGDEFPKLCHYLHTVLSREMSVLITVGQYTVAVAMEGSRVWLFDSHSRNEEGKPEGDFLAGKACLLAFVDVDALVAHLISVYGRDQYCARGFTFYDLADDPVSTEDYSVKVEDVDEAENSCEIGAVGEAVNSNQNAHTSSSQEPAFVNIEEKPLPEVSACLFPKTESSSALPVVLHLLVPIASIALHWKQFKNPYSHKIRYYPPEFSHGRSGALPWEVVHITAQQQEPLSPFSSMRVVAPYVHWKAFKNNSTSTTSVITSLYIRTGEYNIRPCSLPVLIHMVIGIGKRGPDCNRLLMKDVIDKKFHMGVC